MAVVFEDEVQRLSRALVAAVLLVSLGLFVVALRLLGFALLLTLVLRGFFLLGLGGGSSNFGSAYKNGTRLDGKRASFDVSNHFGTAFDVNTLGAGDVSMDLSVDNDGFGFYLCFNVSVLRDGEGTVGCDFSFDASVNEEVVGEFDGTIDVDIIAKNVALAA